MIVLVKTAAGFATRVRFPDLAMSCPPVDNPLKNQQQPCCCLRMTTLTLQNLNEETSDLLHTCDPQGSIRRMNPYADTNVLTRLYLRLPESREAAALLARAVAEQADCLPIRRCLCKSPVKIPE